MPAADFPHGAQLVLAPHVAGRVMGVAENEDLCVRADRFFEYLGIEPVAVLGPCQEGEDWEPSVQANIVMEVRVDRWFA